MATLRPTFLPHRFPIRDAAEVFRGASDKSGGALRFVGELAK